MGQFFDPAAIGGSVDRRLPAAVRHATPFLLYPAGLGGPDTQPGQRQIIVAGG